MIQPLSRLESRILTATTPLAIFLIGVPGSGKSTWLRDHLTYFNNFVILSTDAILDAMALEAGLSYHEMWKLAPIAAVQEQMMAQLHVAVAMDQSIIIDRTNVSTNVRAKIMTHVPSHYVRYAAVFTVGRVELDRRLADRAAKTGKYIPSEIVDDMLDRFEAPTKAEFDEIFS